ncbi:hypothetical protein [Nostoc sp.]|uniref:hypothetical protein n=1 Tax=Nostoc sp. TaxID=1180 RepID=UPI002FF7BDDD
MTAIYRVFVMIYRIFAIYNFHQKTLTEPYWLTFYLVLFQGIRKEKVNTYTTDENGTWRGVVAPRACEACISPD